MFCFECNNPAIHQHHVVPQSKGGTKTVPLCELCHSKVHDHDLTIQALTKSALAKKKANNQRAGQIPYGFVLHSNGVDLVPQVQEQQIIAQVLSLRNQNLSIRHITDYLNSQGLKARGAKWYPTSVARILKRISNHPFLAEFVPEPQSTNTQGKADSKGEAK